MKRTKNKLKKKPHVVCRPGSMPGRLNVWDMANGNLILQDVKPGNERVMTDKIKEYRKKHVIRGR